MNAPPSRELVVALSAAVDARLGQDHPDRPVVMELCNEAIRFSWTLSKDLPEGHPGQRARSAAALLLELRFPEMRAGLRHQLSVACEIIAMGANPTGR